MKNQTACNDAELHVLQNILQIKGFEQHYCRPCVSEMDLQFYSLTTNPQIIINWDMYMPHMHVLSRLLRCNVKHYRIIHSINQSLSCSVSVPRMRHIYLGYLMYLNNPYKGWHAFKEYVIFFISGNLISHGLSIPEYTLLIWLIFLELLTNISEGI